MNTADKQDSSAAAQQLLAKADLALYQAKKAGRNKVMQAS
jgi:GGDEF domain-containing protein